MCSKEKQIYSSCRHRHPPLQTNCTKLCDQLARRQFSVGQPVDRSIRALSLVDHDSREPRRQWKSKSTSPEEDVDKFLRQPVKTLTSPPTARHTHRQRFAYTSVKKRTKRRNSRSRDAHYSDLKARPLTSDTITRSRFCTSNVKRQAGD